MRSDSRQDTAALRDSLSLQIKHESASLMAKQESMASQIVYQSNQLADPCAWKPDLEGPIRPTLRCCGRSATHASVSGGARTREWIRAASGRLTAHAPRWRDPRAPWPRRRHNIRGFSSGILWVTAGASGHGYVFPAAPHACCHW
jgi:hypothetical protein